MVSKSGHTEHTNLSPGMHGVGLWGGAWHFELIALVRACTHTHTHTHTHNLSLDPFLPYCRRSMQKDEFKSTCCGSVQHGAWCGSLLSLR